MALFDSLFSAVKSGAAKAVETQFANQCKELSQASETHLENVIKIKQLNGMIGKIAIIFLYQKYGSYKVQECLSQSNISVKDANQAVAKMLRIDSILLSKDRYVVMVREAGIKFLDEVK